VHLEPHSAHSRTASRANRFAGFLGILLAASPVGAQMPADFPVGRVLSTLTDPASGAKLPLASRFDTGLELARQSYADTRGVLPTAQQRLRRHLPAARVNNAGLLLVDAIAQGSTAALAARLRAVGGTGISSYGRVVSGWVPLSALDALAVTTELRFARPAYQTRMAGRPRVKETSR
jgi:hypothetical protein